MTNFKPVNPQINFPQMEEGVLQFWKENKTFEKSIEQRPIEKHWNFLDGPPFITGLPHYGTLLASIPKDIFPRYWTMKGYRVRRVWGWDVHGLPAENKVENKLGIKRKKDIEEKVGVAKFIEECKEYVSTSSAEWEWYVDHIARWVDFDHAYKTMDLSYMESVMWVFKQMYSKGYIYKGLRVSLYCPHCSTPISNFEVAMDPDNYKDVTDPGTTYKYKLVGEDNTYILAWSTTPWNKLVTPALAVNPKLDYVKVKQAKETYILAKSSHEKVLQGKFEILDTVKGEQLVGLKFEPHYNFYKIDAGKKAFEIFAGDFVTAEEGTGVVTIAVYGEEDLTLMHQENIQIVMHVDEEGKLTKDVPNGWAGMYYLDVNPLVNEDLKKRGLIYRDDPHLHSIPLCWRCHTRLYYAPQDAWYVDVQQLKPAMAKTNESVNWFPKHFKYGRFLKSMESAPDWCISRSRYWGSPVPVWECECGNKIVPGSIAELEKLSGQKITDLHKPGIDEVVVTCDQCGKKVKRVPEVLDSWIEAGSASFGERHYPFDQSLKLEEFYPPDFIVEYTGQIRAWFYVLHVIGCAIFDSPAFKNVAVTGVVLGTDGKKMSKNLGNYPDPKELIQKYGGDALRLYLMSSPVMHGEDVVISEEEYRNQVKGILLTFWNVYNFFVSNAMADNWQPSSNLPQSENALDKWILSRLVENVQAMAADGYEKYDTPKIIEQMASFMRDLSGWYVRRSRDRVGPSATDMADKNQAYSTLYYVLIEFTKAAAPVIPFITEEIYKNLTGEESVHLTDWTNLPEAWKNAALEESMTDGIKVASALHALRKQNNLKVRIPLKSMHYSGPRQLTPEVLEVVLEETNVYKLEFTKTEDGAEYRVSGETSETNQDFEAGQIRELIRDVQKLRKEKGAALSQFISLSTPYIPAGDRLEELKRKVLANEVKLGSELKIELL